MSHYFKNKVLISITLSFTVLVVLAILPFFYSRPCIVTPRQSAEQILWRCSDEIDRLYREQGYLPAPNEVISLCGVIEGTFPEMTYDSAGFEYVRINESVYALLWNEDNTDRSARVTPLDTLSCNIDFLRAISLIKPSVSEYRAARKYETVHPGSLIFQDYHKLDSKEQDLYIDPRLDEIDDLVDGGGLLGIIDASLDRGVLYYKR